MKKPYFNRRERQKKKAYLRKFSNIRKILPKRMGGVIGVSVLVENRDQLANDLETNKKEIL